MSAGSEVHYFCKPKRILPVALPIEFLSSQEFLADEPACMALWEFVSTQFRTRHKNGETIIGLQLQAATKTNSSSINQKRNL